jgi:hypothetical protein
MHLSPTAAAIVALLLTGGGGPERPDARRALPWLHEFPADAVAELPSRGAEAWLRDRQLPAAGCTTSSDAGFALSAELAPAPGLETVLASYTAGVVVLDAHGRRVASAPAFACHGSVDTLEGVAVGELLAGEPVIALAATAGGRAERTTWLFFFALRGDALAPIFAAPVEEWRGEAASTGEVVRLPGGALRYRAPSGAISRWAYDRDAGRFTLREVIRPEPMLGPSA